MRLQFRTGDTNGRHEKTLHHMPFFEFSFCKCKYPAAPTPFGPAKYLASSLTFALENSLSESPSSKHTFLNYTSILTMHRSMSRILNKMNTDQRWQLHLSERMVAFRSNLVIKKTSLNVPYHASFSLGDQPSMRQT